MCAQFAIDATLASKNGEQLLFLFGPFVNAKLDSSDSRISDGHILPKN